MKITFQGETKRVPQINEYYELHDYIAEIFKIDQEETESNSRLYYLDDDGDLISISCQSDLDQAIANQKFKLKLTYSYTDTVARKDLLHDCFAFNDMLLDTIKQQSLSLKTNNNVDLSLKFNPMKNFEFMIQNQIKQAINKIKTDTIKFQNQTQRNGLNSQPLNLSAFCFNQTIEKNEVCGNNFQVILNFKNTGDVAWPNDVCLKQVEGDKIEFKVDKVFDDGVDVNSQIIVPLEITMPMNVGHFEFKLRLSYNNSSMEFGEAINFYISSKIAESYPFQSFVQTEASRMYNDQSQQCSSFVQTESESGYQSEGNTFYIDQDQIISCKSVVPVSEFHDNSWTTASEDNKDDQLTKLVQELQEREESENYDLDEDEDLVEYQCYETLNRSVQYQKHKLLRAADLSETSYDDDDESDFIEDCYDDKALKQDKIYEDQQMICRYLDIISDDNKEYQNSSINDVSSSDHDNEGIESLMQQGFFFYDQKVGGIQMDFDKLS